MESHKPVHSVVLDAGPLLLNQPPISTLIAKSEQLYTVPAVIAEVKDTVARSRLESIVIPFLTIRTPSQASVTTVSEFAKKTGDFVVLSKPDLQILALAYELECERNHGDWRLRRLPGQKGLNGSAPRFVPDHIETVNPAEVEVVKSVSQAQDELSHASTLNTSGSQESNSKLCEVEKAPVSSGTTSSMAQAEGGGPTENLSALTSSPIEQQQERSVDEEHTLVASATVSEPSDAGSGSDSDSDGWITPSNLKRHQQIESGKSTEPGQNSQSTLQVATLTNDFALQNTLLLMNLNLISPSMARISRLKSHVLRCHACFITTKEMSRQFCARCGMPTMTRVSCTTSANGEFRIHLKQNMQWNTRGDRYSIPKPVSGTSSGKTGKGGRGRGGKGGWGRDLLLSEDQKEYSRALGAQGKRREKDLMDEDYLPSILTGQRTSNGNVKVGAGRNVNSRKR